MDLLERSESIKERRTERWNVVTQNDALNFSGLLSVIYELLLESTHRCLSVFAFGYATYIQREQKEPQSQSEK